jgi:hypothetical protein
MYPNSRLITHAPSVQPSAMKNPQTNHTSIEVAEITSNIICPFELDRRGISCAPHGDDTYEALAARRLVKRLLDEQLDFVNGARVLLASKAYRRGHRFGNYAPTLLVRNIFGKEFRDVLSGYKVFSRRFVKSFPATSGGFEVETELTVHALELRMPSAEAPTIYGERAPGSASKLRIFRDGVRILALIADLIRNERPLQFFAALGIVLFGVAIVIDIPLARTYLQTGLVPRLPTAVLGIGLFIIGVLSCLAGLILDMVATMRREMKRLAYLSNPSLGARDERSW